MPAFNKNAEIRLLKLCEKNAHTEIYGKERFFKLLKLFKNLPVPARILDVGGTLTTALWFQKKFPSAKITILNYSKKETSSYHDVIISNAQSFSVKKQYDLIFAGEVLEHLINPDGLLASCLFALKPNGFLIITTPNLSCFYNRLFLLFGWTPGNYSASFRYITGNPFLEKNAKGFKVIGDHKSVFTWQGLLLLLKIYGYKIIDTEGFSYSQNEDLRTFGKNKYVVPGKKIRLFLDKFLPKHLKEGMIILAQKPEIFDLQHARGGILTGNIWDL